MYLEYVSTIFTKDDTLSWNPSQAGCLNLVQLDERGVIRMLIRPCDFSGFFLILGFITVSQLAVKFSWKKWGSYQGKKEVACIVSKPLVSCLWGCGESVNPIFQDFFTFVKSDPWLIEPGLAIITNVVPCLHQKSVFHVIFWIKNQSTFITIPGSAFASLFPIQ